MREIKFRGYSDYHKMWYYGSLVKIHRRYYIYNTYGKRFEVLPETVRQYTGLKDKNGKDIYEGDILKVENYSSFILYSEVHCGYIFNSYMPNGWIHSVYFASKVGEIIGNIHEIPELLK